MGFANKKSLIPVSPSQEELAHFETIAVHRSFPVFMGCTAKPQEDDLFSDMHWLRNRMTDEIIIRPIIDSVHIYQENHNEVVGATWKEHHLKFGEFVAKHMSGEKVFEIGGAHGMASLSARKKNPRIQWTIQDLNPIPVPEYVGEVVKGEFGSGEATELISYKTIAHSHTLEHVHDQFSFLASINSALEIGSRHILSWPNMDLMLRKRNLSFLNFEHTSFLPLNRVLALLESTGFTVIDTFCFGDHSIFIATEKVSAIKNPPVFVDRHLGEFDDYFESLSISARRLNQVIQEFRGEIYLFGAHIFSQMLISAGLDVSRIGVVLDNALHKQDKRLYGTSLIVKNPEILRERNQESGDILVIAAVGEYFEEVEQQLLAISSSIQVLGLK